MGVKSLQSVPLETFIKYRDELVQQVRSGRMHYDLYCNLRRKVRDFEPEFNRAPNFWSLTLNAHLEAFRISLCRVYDQEKSSLGLHCWLTLFRNELLSLEHRDEAIRDRYHCNPLTEEELDQDLAKVVVSDCLVKTLVKQRGSAIAHVGAKKIVKGSSGLAGLPMKFTDWGNLLERADLILNRYSILQTGESFAFLSHQSHDFQVVLNDIRRGRV